MPETDKSKNKERDTSWYARTGGSAVYGPVSISILKEWVAQGRIKPEHEVSTDRENWRAAKDVAELELDWVADLEDKTTFGPFHFRMAEELLNNGVLAPGTTIRNHRTGETYQMKGEKAPAGEEVQEDTQKEPQDSSVEETSESSGQPENESSTDENNSTVEPQPEPEEHARRSDPVSQRLEAIQRSASEVRRQLAEARKQLSKQKAINIAMQDNITRLQEDLRSAESERDACNNQLMELQQRLTESMAEEENRNAQLLQLQEHYERIQVENQTQFEELDQLRAESMRREQEYRKQLSDAIEKAEGKTATLLQALRVLADDDDVRNGVDIPQELLEEESDEHIQDLQQQISQLRQQLEYEQNKVSQLEYISQPTTSNTPTKLIIGLLLAILMGLIVIIFMTYEKTETPQQTPPVMRASPLSSTYDPNIQIPTDTEESTVAPSGETTAEASVATGNPGESSTMDLPPESSAARSAGIVTRTVWPELELPRARISHNNRAMRILFSYGLFSSETELTPEAKIDIGSLVAQLDGNIEKFTIIVEGHTDSTPISHPRADHVNNFALGMARAKAVKDFMEKQCGVPEGIIKTASAGESDPPYSNDTAESRLKNRTAIITLKPRKTA